MDEPTQPEENANPKAVGRAAVVATGVVSKPVSGGEAAKSIRGEAADTTRGEAADTTRGEAADTTRGEAAETIRDRALALSEYLLAVRALIEKPVRTVPLVDALWQRELPSHPACEIGPRQPGGAWLRVGRPAPPTPPVIPTGLIRHLVWDLSATNSPSLRAEVDPSAVATPVEVVDPVVGEQFDAWYEHSWLPWSRETQAAEATRALHDRLYDLRYRLDIDVARLELVWGHAILDGKLAGERVHYPLLATPVAIEYDPDTTTVSVVPQGPARLQPDALSDVDTARVGDLLDLGGTGGQVDVDAWDATERREFATKALRRLGFDPVLSEPHQPTPGGPHVLDTGVLFARPRQRMVRRFLEGLRERLDGDGDASVGALAGILAHEPSRLRLPDDAAEAWALTGGRLLMPLPTNDAQESIARRLAEHRNVAVQGPPGTGKTHTIRNLICHLVAHGKRVLVLAQKEDPLRVLRDGLPAEIQPLCLAILGRSADQLVQLQIAARELSDRAATLDQDAESAWVRRLGEDLARAEADLAAAQAELRLAAERESQTFSLGTGAASPGPHEQSHTPGEVGEWLRRHKSSDGFIPDSVAPGAPLPLEVPEFAVLFELARRIPALDRAAALGLLPQDGTLPTGEALSARRDALRDAWKVVDALADRGLSTTGIRDLGEPALAELARHLRVSADDLTRREGSWTDRLGQLLRDPSWQAVWDGHVSACQALVTELGRQTSFLAGHTVEVPEEHAEEPRRLLTQLGEARQRLAAGKKVNRLTQGDLHKLLAECRVDGEPLRTATDVDLVMSTVDRTRLRQELAKRWAEWGARLDAPVPTGDPRAQAEPELWAGRLLTEAVDALDWERRRWPALRTTLARLDPRTAAHPDARTLAELAGAVEAAENVYVVDRYESQDRAMEEWLARTAGEPTASPVVRRLNVAWREGDFADWDVCLAEIGRLWTIRDDATRYAALHARLSPVCPQWAAQVDAGEPGVLPERGEDALRAWRWRQAQTWFDDVVGTADADGLGRRVERCREQIRRTTRELVVSSAWLEVARSLDDRKKAALADWTAALRKIGKGTGKSAAHWQGVAQKAMDEAVTAVPVWVMSIDRALEQFRGGEPLFDVVVVDEASQADIFSLPVLSLASRAVVVGDDQQIGPQLVGVPTERVNALIGTHLDDVPSAEHFDTESSLYDHAVRRSPERILLVEHFRCVPTIISFSSDTYYDRKIQPLRADRPTGIGAPVTAVFVPDGKRTTRKEYGEVNVPEAEALAAKVAQIVADPAYDGKTLGVVSLLSSSGQARYLQHRLRELIGPEVLERRALRVGDPYTFQGDERDIVLISLVVSARDGALGAFTKRDFHRRVNVAASRARDQLWLFHSVQVGDLPGDDARALLLAHCQRPRAVEDAAERLEDRCENDFERAVLRRMLDRGLRPVPQFRLGTFRIDFVLTAPDGRRLAVECDGDRYQGPDAFAADLRRQAILERVGNCVFVRLRASRFHRDPEAALAPVWERARELGLTSATGESVRPAPTAESVRPAPTAESVRPAPTAESVRPAPTAESVRPAER